VKPLMQQPAAQRAERRWKLPVVDRKAIGLPGKIAEIDDAERAARGFLGCERVAVFEQLVEQRFALGKTVDRVIGVAEIAQCEHGDREQASDHGCAAKPRGEVAGPVHFCGHEGARCFRRAPSITHPSSATSEPSETAMPRRNQGAP
jgi:hypothetical protein